MRSARRIFLTATILLIIPAAFAQTPPAPRGDDLDVTMRVIVDPNAKVPDDIVRRISLPKPAQPGAPSDKPAADKPAESQGKDKPSVPSTGAQGRDFGQQMAEEAKQRADEAKRNKPPSPGKPDNPGPPPAPPGRPQTPPPGG